MRYTVTRQRISLIGHIWMPQGIVCAQQIDLTAHDLENLGNPESREDVENWLTTHSGDFSEVLDFQADFHIGDKHVLHDWAKGEDSAIQFSDAMYPAEE